MEKKFNFNPDSYHMQVKDFIGNELHVGDTVAVAERTYSKTPYFVVWVIKKIETKANKKGELSSFDLHLFESASSEETYGFKSGLYADIYGTEWSDDIDPDDEDCWEVYTFSSKSFINVLKISNNG